MATTLNSREAGIARTRGNERAHGTAAANGSLHAPLANACCRLLDPAVHDVRVVRSGGRGETQKLNNQMACERHFHFVSASAAADSPRSLRLCDKSFVFLRVLRVNRVFCALFIVPSYNQRHMRNLQIGSSLPLLLRCV